MKGPLEALAGVVYGIVFGVLAWYLPSKKQVRMSVCEILCLHVHQVHQAQHQHLQPNQSELLLSQNVIKLSLH